MHILGLSGYSTPQKNFLPRNAYKYGSPLQLRQIMIHSRCQIHLKNNFGVEVLPFRKLISSYISKKTTVKVTAVFWKIKLPYGLYRQQYPLLSQGIPFLR
jgi:hypothetical protein